MSNSKSLNLFNELLLVFTFLKTKEAMTIDFLNLIKIINAFN